jgi:hypothetical protein
MNLRSLQQNLDVIGLPWMTVLLIALASSLVYLGPSLWQTWTHDGPTLVNPAGFVTGHDFVAFYAASKAVLGGDAAMVYDRDFMLAAQIEIVGASDIGYLAFMYPPTYLLLVAPLATLPYSLALALWQTLPFVILLLLLRRIALPRIALIMAAGAPAVAQALFAGQNGLVFALCLGGGLMVLDRRPLLAGLMLGLATAKPQLAALLVPALIAGREWKVLVAMFATGTGMAVLSAVLFGPDVWSNYVTVPGDARDFLALGQLPWSRMPTLYTAARLAGLSDTAGTVLQAAGTSMAVAGIAWIWWKGGPANLRIASVLAGVPLATPFLYDYDLPFMLFAIGLYLADAQRRGPALWEKILLLLVWLQPVWWWWWLVDATGVSPSPLVYAMFFMATLYRARTTVRGGEDARST